MSDTLEVLADLACLEVKGPAVVFLRPRREMSDEEAHDIGRHLAEIGHQWRRQGVDVMCLLMPHDIDIFAVGDAELKKYGLARLPEGAAK